MWCGTKSGKIYIFHAKTYAQEKGVSWCSQRLKKVHSQCVLQMPKILSAHEDFIRTMTMTDIDLVVSGSGSNDGYAAVWKAIQI